MALTRYDSTDIVISTDQVITSTWTGNTNTLINGLFWTSSDQYRITSATSSGQFYLDVYNANPAVSSSAEVQFSIAYGNKVGSGSENYTINAKSDGYSAARTIYGQYRTLVYGDEDTNFAFGTHTPDDIFVINVERARYKEHLRTAWNLTLETTSSAAGSSTIKLTDDSSFNSGSSVITNVGRQFNILSGTNGNIYSGSNINLTISGSYGLFYPDAGFMILNANALRASNVIAYSARVASSSDATGTIPVTDRTASLEMFRRMKSGSNFELDSVENLSSQFFFTRVKNSEYNYTSNPTFIDSEGNVKYSSMINDPTTYITTVGLYNDDSELLAVAKLSKPLAKDFTKEALIRVKLDY